MNNQREQDMGILYKDLEKQLLLKEDKKIYEREFVKKFYDEIDKKNIILPEMPKYMPQEKINSIRKMKSIVFIYVSI